ncbi:helix-turn-helix domain-containing protein [Acidovorax sp. LjRoot129]|uniref:helix-turn-helix domain-containing protein n=1 Tax=Acidovorax sp. LjRoot129 TaxID=3342260 RepID=UPI003ECCD0D7
MNTEFRVLVAGRLREEREKLGLSQTDMAELGGTKARTYQDWERAVAAVGTEFLALAALRGLDAAYVLTGVRGNSGNLSPDESALLDLYKRADADGRGIVQAVAGLASRGSGVANQSGAHVHIAGSVGQQVQGDQTVTAPMTFNVGKGRK